MAANEIEIAAAREQVWAVLADAEHYDDWVVGAQDVQGADADYPAEGAALHHRSGLGPFALEDETRVLEQHAPDRLVLRARLRPLGEVEVRFSLLESPTGTRLVMEEEPVEGLLASLPGADAALGARNALTLRRLKALAER